MSDLTPNAVALRLAELSRMLDTCRNELVQADEEAVRARQRYEVTYAKEFLSAEASNAETRKQIAVLGAAAHKFDAEIADQKVRALKTRLSVLRDQVDVGRSLGAAVRSEWAATT